MDALIFLGKHLRSTLLSLAALAFILAGIAFAEGDLANGIIRVLLGLGDLVFLFQLRATDRSSSPLAEPPTIMTRE